MDWFLQGFLRALLVFGFLVGMLYVNFVYVVPLMFNL